MHFNYAEFKTRYRAACAKWDIDPEVGPTSYQVALVKAESMKQARARRARENPWRGGNVTIETWPRPVVSQHVDDTSIAVKIAQQMARDVLSAQTSNAIREYLFEACIPRMYHREFAQRYWQQINVGAEINLPPALLQKLLPLYQSVGVQELLPLYQPVGVQELWREVRAQLRREIPPRHYILLPERVLEKGY